MRLLLLFLFFLSGAAALVYEIAWARSLGVVFGASHLSVATVLAVYMGGQALGSALLGARADRTARPLRLYGLLELGIGLSALAFLGLMAVYPSLYVPLARVSEESPVYLTVVRTAFAVVAMIVPTTLMGGTLPTLARFFASRGGGLGRQLSILYAFNTFGAVAGSLSAGFVLLPGLGVRRTLIAAAAVSLGVGLASILLQRRQGASTPALAAPAARGRAAPRGGVSDLTARLALLVAGVSGFCALGYEVLWTRMLTLVVGTSVYSFTIMLVAFLSGIALGSHAFGLLHGRGGVRAPALVLGAAQVLIGLTALGVTVLMRDLPAAAGRMHASLAASQLSELGGRVAASFGVAFAYMVVPAFFMGMAFPVAAAVWTSGRDRTGSDVGRLLTVNTAGAILGSVTSGFALIQLFGIERSLQLLVIVNVTAGLAIGASVVARPRAVALVAGLGGLLLVARGLSPSWGRAWDEAYLATASYSTGRSVEAPERVRERLRDTEVLYYHEGVNETVSVTRPRGDVHQAFIVNGRPEASTAPVDVQLQRALGHLPMLLHRRPRSVFVLGTGSGMTLGATSIHPQVERIVLAEIEEGVLGVARTFSAWNANVLESPRLHVVFNDGRNHLASTAERFDVITADPIHPWSGGAAYLYTAEYFRSVAEHLAPGGVASQWLPLYELSTHDVRTVLRTFAGAFSNVMVWLTYYDAVLIGSNEPLAIDERAIARRLADPRIRDDLAAVHMGTAEDLLSYFLMGDRGARAFGRSGDVNTDDNLALEFSAPASQGILTDGDNVQALSGARESLVPYLAPSGSEEARRREAARWNRNEGTARIFDPAHVLFLRGDHGSPALEAILSAARARDPGYGPLRFLLAEKHFAERCEPALVAEATFVGADPRGRAVDLRISAVRQFHGRGRVLVSFVDNARRDLYAERYVYGPYEQLEERTARYVEDTLRSARAATTVMASSYGRVGVPDVKAVLRREAARLAPPPPR